jgi:hypothetical protein
MALSFCWRASSRGASASDRSCRRKSVRGFRSRRRLSSRARRRWVCMKLQTRNETSRRSGRPTRRARCLGSGENSARSGSRVMRSMPNHPGHSESPVALWGVKQMAGCADECERAYFASVYRSSSVAAPARSIIQTRARREAPSTPQRPASSRCWGITHPDSAGSQHSPLI